ncbi:phosphoglycolate phosphatase-like HAD superfamily hydrolase [Amaricoccus macauensis]|uniref:phosphoglycolate phosphatase n=1 Tax=Amaricoccus macauensis TaxID=57001 RepID=A0A840SF11_9RHOB|nr:HAD family hydrolase [Amaricoccus macauensis]MBB5220417.1 phosphoglycolate phosphatase-like HAD superfamily hydrolase [Amaricoccus macauensis]
MTDTALLSLPRRPAAMLLDFDGVVLVSAEIKTRAFAEIYRDEDPAHVAGIVAYHRAHGGVSRDEKFRHFEATLFHRPADQARVAALSARFTDIVLSAVLAAPFVDGAEDFLEATCDASRLHVISGTPEEELRHIVAARGLERFFHSVVGAPTLKRDAFARILAAEGVAPERALAVGDSTTEFDAARSLGIPFLGIRDEEGGSAFPPDVPVLASLAGAAAALGFA